jgi:hypothetical protein
MGIASPPAAARNVTVENFLPQQKIFYRNKDGNGGLPLFSNFLK